MKTKPYYDLSDRLIDFLLEVSVRSQPLLASSVSEMVEFVQMVRLEGYVLPANQSVEQAMHQAVSFLNSRLPSRLRIVEYPTGFFVTEVVCANAYPI